MPGVVPGATGAPGAPGAEGAMGAAPGAIGALVARGAPGAPGVVRPGDAARCHWCDGWFVSDSAVRVGTVSVRNARAVSIAWSSACVEPYLSAGSFCKHRSTTVQ